MTSVTQRIKQIKQPRGGYLPPKSFSTKQLETKAALSEIENIHAGLVGLAVDYLTRALISGNTKEAFFISLRGAALIREADNAQSLLGKIEPLISSDKKSDDLWAVAVIASCRLTGYDVCFRAGVAGYKPVQDITPDENTINNIRIMVERSLGFFKEYGPVVKDGVTFSIEAFSSAVHTGDGDFATTDTIWDFKVSKKEPTDAHTLQLLMYWVMGQRCKGAEFEYFGKITRLGIFNPRLNRVYTKAISEIPRETIHDVERDVFCYS